MMRSLLRSDIRVLSARGGFGDVERQQVADVVGFLALRQLGKRVA